MDYLKFKQAVERFEFPAIDYSKWDDGLQYQVCCIYYSLMDFRPYEYNPYSQGEMLCRSLGISIDYLGDVRHKFYLDTESEIRTLLEWVVEDAAA